MLKGACQRDSPSEGIRKAGCEEQMKTLCFKKLWQRRREQLSVFFCRSLPFRWQYVFAAPLRTACAPSPAAQHPLPGLTHRWVNFPENPAQAIKMLMLWGKCLRWSKLIRESVVLGGRGTVYWFWTRSYLIRLATWIIFVCADQLPSPWFHSKFEITLMKQKFERGRDGFPPKTLLYYRNVLPHLFISDYPLTSVLVNLYSSSNWCKTLSPGSCQPDSHLTLGFVPQPASSAFPREGGNASKCNSVKNQQNQHQYCVGMG